MLDRHSDAKGAVFTSAAILIEIMTLYDRCGLPIAAAQLSSALDAACLEAGLQRSDLDLPFGQTTRNPPLAS